jgi:molybdopterin-guanine dinucleotide biosynthesis protein B
MKAYGITGFKNAGKTTLTERLVTEITARGYSVSTVKHAHHAIDIDNPGKDTHRHRAAGARQVMLATSARWALMTELRDQAEPELPDLLARMDPVDIVLVEGFKRGAHPKIEVYRAGLDHPLMAPGDPTIRAVASNMTVAPGITRLDLDDIPAIADFILRDLGLWRGAVPGDAGQSVLMVDWSGGNDRGPAPKADAIWTCLVSPTGEETRYHRNRRVAEAWITGAIGGEIAAGRGVLAGFDFPFAAPAGFARALTGEDDPLALWDWFAAHVEDAPQANNRFDLAGAINARFPGTGPFWGNGLARDIPHLPRKGNARDFRWIPAKRLVETRAKGAFECWQLAGAGSVGSQMILGMPMLARLRQRFATAVWPWERHAAPLTLVEIWPSLITAEVRAATRPGDIRDAVQVRVMARTVAAMPPGRRAAFMDVTATPEGWIFGVDREGELADLARQTAAMDPP